MRKQLPKSLETSARPCTQRVAGLALRHVPWLHPLEIFLCFLTIGYYCFASLLFSSFIDKLNLECIL